MDGSESTCQESIYDSHFSLANVLVEAYSSEKYSHIIAYLFPVREDTCLT